MLDQLDSEQVELLQYEGPYAAAGDAAMATAATAAPAPARNLVRFFMASPPFVAVVTLS